MISAGRISRSVIFFHLELRERIVEFRPRFLTRLRSFRVEQAGVQTSSHPHFIEILADKYQLLHAVAKLQIPARLLIGS